MLREEEMEIQIGRAHDGLKPCSFIRVIHLPTAIARYQVGFQGLTGDSIRQRLQVEIEAELQSRGLTQYLVPAYPVKNRRQQP
jgi:hypothetical protein